MSDLVQTTRGLLPREQLTFKDSTTEDAKSICTTREWFDTTDGVCVRRDGWADMKRGEEIGLSKGVV